MPKRVIDFDAMWGSDKLASCAAWAQAEYAWLYGLADASGSFELTNLRVIWGRVAAVRETFTVERLEQVFAEFRDKGLLFVWEHEGKRYAHWTGSDVPGRLPSPSWRVRLERFAPPVPKEQLAEYTARLARGRAALGGAGFRGAAPAENCHRKEELKTENRDWKEEQGRGGRNPGAQLTEERLLVSGGGEDHRFERSDLRENRRAGEHFRISRVGETAAGVPVETKDEIGQKSQRPAGESRRKEYLEEAQGQDLGLDWNLNGNWEVGRDEKRSGPRDAQNWPARTNREKDFQRPNFSDSNSKAKTNSPGYEEAYLRVMSPKELALARELRVGQGPVCGPGRVKPEVLERDRQRQAAIAKLRTG